MHACNSANDKPVDQPARIGSTKPREREECVSSGGGKSASERERVKDASNRCTRARGRGGRERRIVEKGMAHGVQR